MFLRQDLLTNNVKAKYTKDSVMKIVEMFKNAFSLYSIHIGNYVRYNIKNIIAIPVHFFTQYRILLYEN